MRISTRGKATPFRILAVVLYMASLLMTPYRTLEPNIQMRGFEILFLDWGGLPNTLAWLANPLLIFSLIVMSKRSTAAIVSTALALLLSIDFKDIQTLGRDSSRDIEAGQVISIGVGAYVWLASIICTLLASIVSAIEGKSRSAKWLHLHQRSSSPKREDLTFERATSNRCLSPNNTNKKGPNYE